LAQLWTVHHSRTVRRGQEPNLRVKSRLGASVLHDGLWTWREEFGGQGDPPSRPLDPFSNPTPLPLSKSPASIVQQQPAVAKTQEISLEICDGQVQQQQMVQSNTSNQNIHDMNNLASDLSNFDWIWDVGFPSLLPIDIDSHPCPPAI